MRQIAMRVAGLTAGAVLMLAAQAHAQVVIHVGSASGDAGGTTTFDVTLSTGTAMVAGTQNDITFQPGAVVAAKANGKPNCTVNEAIDKAQTTFAFQPPNCTGTACTGIRALVLSFENTTPIPDGATLYTCNVNIATDASGDQTLTCSNSGASDPSGGPIAATCTNGAISVGGGGQPTATPTEGPISGTIIHVGSTSGNVGQPGLSFDVTLETDGIIAGTQNDVTFSTGASPPISVNAKANGKPDCTVNEAIDKAQTTFAFQPPNCTGDACTGIRALVLSFENTTPIETGSVLYTCNITINGTAMDGHSYPLTCSNSGASDPGGGPIAASCTNGAVAVGGPITGVSTLASAITATDTTIPLADASTFPNSGTVKIDDELITYTGKDGNNLTGATRGANGTTAAAHAAGAMVSLQQVVVPTPTATPSTVSGTATVTPTGGGTAGATATRTPIITVGPINQPCDDSCAIVSPADHQAVWMLLLPAAVLIWLRRRSR